MGRVPRTGGTHRPAGSRGRGPVGPPPGGMGGPGRGMGDPGMPPPPPRRPWHRHPGPGMPPPFHRPRRRRRGGGCLSTLLAVVVLMCIVICIASLSYERVTDHHSPRRETAQGIQITPLPASAVQETAYFTDELGWIRRPSSLEDALKSFYTATGVQPHIYLSSAGLAQSEADELYGRLFTDEGHFLLVVTDDWDTVYILGDDAARVLTDSVTDLFWENFDDCADSSRSDEDVLADAFTYTAYGLSSGASRDSGAATENEHRTAVLFLILAVAIFLIVVAVIITVIIRARKNARYEQTAGGSFAPNTGNTGDASRHTAPTDGGFSGSGDGGPQPRGYNLNGEFHTYDEDRTP